MNTTVLPGVGERVRGRDQFTAMPTGTVIAEEHHPENTYTKMGENNWQAANGGRTYDDSFVPNYNVVLHYPDGAAPPPPTLHQFKWRFRDNALAGMEAHGVNRNVVRDGLRTLGVEDPADFPPGVGLTVACSEARDALPEGSVVMVGTPGALSTFALYEKQRARWVRVLGERRSWGTGVPSTVELLGGTEVHQDWIDAVGTDADAAEVANWKARAWAVSAKVKSSQSWCSTFDHVLAQVGVDATCLARTSHAGREVGDVVGSAGAAALPVGTVFTVDNEDWGRAWFVRVADSPNRAGTRKVAGWPDSGANYTTRMTIAAFPTENGETFCPVPAETWDHLLPGTIFTISGNESRWMLAADHRAYEWYQGGTEARATGNYRQSDFGSGARFIVIQFGEPA